jgi:hypothetical protein
MHLIDPEALPFDPAEPEYDEDSDGAAEERNHSRSWFATGIEALRRRLGAR